MKRQRENDFNATCVPSRKRRVIHQDNNDENAFPPSEQYDENDATLDTRWGFGSLENPFVVSNNSIEQTTPPSKHATRVQTSASCFTKINGIFRSTKAVSRRLPVLNKVAAC